MNKISHAQCFQMLRRTGLFVVFIFLPIICVNGQDDKGRSLTYRYSQRLADWLPAPLSLSPVPRATDSFWRKEIPLAMRQNYISRGKEKMGKSWEQLPSTLFSEYRKNGNRSNYENECFELRRRFAFLVMAEIMENEGRFCKDITAGLHYFFQEPWWGVPAHYPTDTPDKNNQVVDLFNAETASMLAWTSYMLKGTL